MLLFLPIGLLVVLVARTLRRTGAGLLVGTACLLPVVVEALQWAFLSLLRACDTTDLVDNTSV